ncbi:uncharacterized protein LOC130669182 [Microplitis mediator]|uniref:uncharacterized protein LOC130669182 n=1 Tax=Microplitis mediator TaxID=375433 RepID=UPI0025544037|nr:uncharacterized protein LOC130669182 [Microplitis mediator]
MSSSESLGSSDDDTAMNVEKEARLVENKLIANKSSAVYNLCYQNFVKWKEDKKIKEITESVLLVYFNELTKSLKPSTLWSRWSMLKTQLNLKHSINIDTFHKLKTLLKNNGKGFKPKKSKVLSMNQIKTFLNDATDEIYLAMKVILIFGFCGALRSGEYCSIKTYDVEDTGSRFIVNIQDTKNYYPRSFVIQDEYSDTVRKYVALRPENTELDRFFILYDKGICKRQPIGKNTITEVPKKIAEFLKLPDASSYTGHCFRRTSATLLANAGASLTTLKQHGGWRSSTVVEGYIENSLCNKTKIFNQIVNSSENVLTVRPNNSLNTTTKDQNYSRPSTSTSNVSPVAKSTISSSNANKENLPAAITNTVNQNESTESSFDFQNEPVTENDIIWDEEFDNLEFDYQFSPIPDVDPNLKSTNQEKLPAKSKSSNNSTDTKSLGEVNMNNPIIKINNCKIMNVTINYSK